MGESVTGEREASRVGTDLHKELTSRAEDIRSPDEQESGEPSSKRARLVPDVKVYKSM